MDFENKKVKRPYLRLDDTNVIRSLGAKFSPAVVYAAQCFYNNSERAHEIRRRLLAAGGKIEYQTIEV